MSKPLLVLRKHPTNNNIDKSLNQSDDDISSQMSQTGATNYDVSAIINKKIMFKTRPNPIVANVPKTL